jgi:integrase
MNTKGNSVVIKNGVRLFKQPKSPNWTAVIRIGNEELRKTTGKCDLNEATVVALSMEVEALVKVKLGYSIKNIPSFSDMARKVIDGINADSNSKANDQAVVAAIENYLIPYFGKKSVSKILRPEIYAFYLWREQSTGRQISSTQRSNTDNAFRRIFNLACDLGYIQQSNIPILPKPKIARANPRRHFKKEIVRRIFSPTNLDSFISKSRTIKALENRTFFQYYIGFLFLTGIRPGEETINLKYRDISFHNDDSRERCVANVTSGKTRSYSNGRGIFVDEVALKILTNAMKSSHIHSDLESIRAASASSADDYIFAIYSKEGVARRPDFTDVMDQYMSHLELNGEGYTLYSFRHTYITFKLLNNISAYDVAKQCGTSEFMINKFYDHVVPVQKAKELEFPPSEEYTSFYEWMGL